MDAGKFETVKIEGNIDCNEFNETFQIGAVKYDPDGIDIFKKCKSYFNSTSSSEMDVNQKHDTNSYQEQNEETFEEKNLDRKDLDHSKYYDNSSTSTVGIKNDPDIFFVDIKHETVEEKSSEIDENRFCEVCYQSFDGKDISGSTGYGSQCSCQKQNLSVFYNILDQDMTSDVKPTCHDLTTDLGLRPLEVQDETISGNENTDEQVSSAIPQRPKSTPVKIDDKITSKFCSEPLENTLSEAEKKIQCTSCSKSFSKISALKIHERIHTGEKPFRCKICSKAFAQAGGLTTHQRIHTGEKPFLCIICSKSFTQMSSLKVHERGHAGEKPFKCKICSRSFGTRGNLKMHERVHTGEKAFHCKICSKAFDRSNSLREHEKIHTGEKPFRCKICSKPYINMSNLKIHERGHTGEKPFQCKICSKPFVNTSGLKIHERSHTGEQVDG